MVPNEKPRRWRFQFTLGNILVLTLGVALGFAPLRLWELHARPQQHIAVHIRMLKISPDKLPEWKGLMTASAGGQDQAKLLAQIDDFCQAGHAKMISSPHVMTISGQTASFAIGGGVPIPVVTDDGLVAVEYKHFGTEMTFHPILARNGRIQLSVETAIMEMIPTETEGSDSSAKEEPPPKFSSRSLSSTQEVASGETVFLGQWGDGQPRDGSQKDLVVIATVEALPRR